MTLLEVGGVSLRLHIPAGAARDAIVARFARHAHGYSETLPDRRALAVRVEGATAFIEFEGQVGRIDLEAGEVHSPASPVLCDALVRAAVAWRLARRDAVFLHSSAIRVETARGVIAVVFFGASGAGKSTLAAAHGDFISDELAHVEAAPETGPKAWRVHPTPWWHGKGAPAPLGQLVWIVRGERPSVRRVGGAELLRALLQETGRYLPIPDFQSRVFDLCARLARGGALRVAAAEGRVVQDVNAALAEHTKEAA